jgi:hypothetical protein
MIKNKLLLEIVKGDRTYQMVLSPDSPLGECFDVLSEMRGYILDRIIEENKKQSEAQSETPKE